MEDLNSPATKGDLQELRSELQTVATQIRSELQQIADQLHSEGEHRFNELRESISDSQTEVLKAFYSFVQSNQERVRATEDAEAALKKRLAVLEDRMVEVERRLNMPPAA
jgi:hypothetical protein